MASARNLADLAQRVRLPATVTSVSAGVQELSDACVRAVDALRPSGSPPRPNDPQLDTAEILHGLFAKILDQPEFGLSGAINSVIERRGSPREQFLAQYQRFAEPLETGLGTGPPVAAGVADAEEWETIAAVMLHDPGSIVPALQRVG